MVALVLPSNIEFLHSKKINPNLKCVYCEKLLKKPKQTNCGHRFCEDCLEQLIEDSSGAAVCPVDSEELNSQEIFPDRCCEKDIEKLECYCTNRKLGCEWQGQLLNLKEHGTKCKYSLVECPNPGCKEQIENRHLADHVQNMCNFRLITCENCGEQVIHSDKEQHQEQCPKVEIQCTTGCGAIVPRGELDEHVTKHCVNAPIACPFEQTGCNFKETVAVNPDLPVQEESHFFENTLPGNNAAAPGLRSMSSSSITPDERLDRNDHQLTLHDTQLAEHDLKIQMLQATSYNGTYIWKIDEFSRRNHEGIIGKTPSIYSPPFYVDRHGYKVCARAYPNGDGMGKGTHLSLFFVIMKGEYDGLLPWPFRQKVTFKLFDQDRQQDVTDTLIPDPNSSSFKRPTTNMNTASGCPLFVSHQVLQSRSYVKDDTMFIKITVNTAGLPPL